jgi:hypothetical protein
LLLALQTKPLADRKDLLRTVRTTLRTAFAKTAPYQSDVYTRDSYLRFVAWAANHLSSYRLWLWGRWYYRGKSWFYVIGVVIFVLYLLASFLRR